MTTSTNITRFSRPRRPAYVWSAHSDRFSTHVSESHGRAKQKQIRRLRPRLSRGPSGSIRRARQTTSRTVVVSVVRRTTLYANVVTMSCRCRARLSNPRGLFLTEPRSSDSSAFLHANADGRSSADRDGATARPTFDPEALSGKTYPAVE